MLNIWISNKVSHVFKVNFIHFWILASYYYDALQIKSDASTLVIANNRIQTSWRQRSPFLSEILLS
jgi:hypothetical protein